MPDDPKKRGKPDRSRIAITQAHELEYWSKKFKCTKLELILAANALRNVGWTYLEPATVGSIITCAKRDLAKAMKRR